MTPTNFSHFAVVIWSVTDLLRGDFKQSQYGRIILPFTLLRRLECVLAPSKDAVLKQFEQTKTMNLPEEGMEKMLLRAAGLSFFNTSTMDLSSLSQTKIKSSLINYIQSFSKDVRDIFENFKFDELVSSLNEANLLYKVIQKFATTDLSLQAISNHDIGLVFEELIFRFVESSNETTGEHFTPRDIVSLTSSLVFIRDAVVTTDGIIRTIYDPTAGTGGFLSAGMEYVHEQNSNAVMRAFGQELNPESFAICKASMLIKGQDASSIKLGNTLSNDQHPTEKFDYMLSNPPFGVDWRKIEDDIQNEHKLKGFDGRFGAGLPRLSDGSLLFLMHLISKLKDIKEGGGRIGVILNGSPLFTGGAGSGESEIRRFIIEHDLLEGIVTLPNGMFYNTGIKTYLLLLTNNKNSHLKHKVKLLDTTNLAIRMRKFTGSKSHLIDEDAIQLILNNYSQNSNTDFLKIVDSSNFGFRSIKVILSDSSFSNEIVPIRENAESYLEAHLTGVFETFKIDHSFIDDKDKMLGKVGYEFREDLFSENVNEKQFRSYFDKVSYKDDWQIKIHLINNKVTFGEEKLLNLIDDPKAIFLKLKPHSCLNLDFLKHYFSSNDWIDQLNLMKSKSISSALSKESILRMGITFPSIENQHKIVEVIDEIQNCRENLRKLESDVWITSLDADVDLKYRIPISLAFQEQLINIAPFPIANIIHHSKNIPDDDYKTRYELLLKTLECASLFLVSSVLGYLDIKENESTNKLLRSQKQYLKNSSFGTWATILEKLSESLEGKDFFKSIVNEKTLNIINSAVNIRNRTTGHGAYPTKFAARETFNKVDKLYLQFMEIIYPFFERFTLIRPKTCKWDGKSYLYQIESFNGLGCYPFGSMHFNSEMPLQDGSLYLKSRDGEPIKLFPFVAMIDIEDDSGLEAFYFFSKMVNSEATYISHQQILRQEKIHINESILDIFK